MKKYEKIVYIVLAVIILILGLSTLAKSGYALAPQDLSITQDKAGGKAESIFDLPYDVKCVPGPQDTAASYTKSLTPGGFCGDQQWVAAQANYTITDGIGSSLLS